MTPTSNPTAMSAVVGEEIRFSAESPRATAWLKHLIMPVLLLAFAAYLGFGMLTMRVPEGTAFPGPRFFPAIIAGGLVLFAILLILAATRQLQADSAARTAATGQNDDIELLSSEHLARGESDETPRDGARSVKIDWRSLAWVIGSFAAFALLLDVLGWIIAAGLLFWCVARGFGSQKPVASLVTGFTVSSLAYIAFDMALGMSLPSGILGGGF